MHIDYYFKKKKKESTLLGFIFPTCGVKNFILNILSNNM